MSSALYRQHEERRDIYIPSELTMGPWRPGAQHGSPPSALLTHLCLRHCGPTEHLARISIDLLAGIPLEELRVEHERIESSRRVTHAEAGLFHRDRPVARARALILRIGPVPEPDWRPDDIVLPHPDTVDETDAPMWASPAGTRPFHRFGIEHRFVSGSFSEPGPAVDWVRLRPDVVAGQESSGYERVVGLTDVGSGISFVFDPANGIGMINADLVVAFADRPVGSWFALMSATEVGATGTGTAVTRIIDQTGRQVALASQSLLPSPITPT